MTKYHVYITYVGRKPRVLTVGDYADVADLAQISDKDLGNAAMEFATEDDATACGHLYCNAKRSHPVFGAPGFEVRTSTLLDLTSNSNP
jgi:hypothetical protein